MKHQRSALAGLLAAAVLFTACTSSANNSNNGVVVTASLDRAKAIVGGIPCEFPLSEGGDSLNILMCCHGTTSAEDNYVLQKYEEMTGVNVNWTCVTKSERKEAVYNTLANKADIDLIMRCKIDASDLLRYGENGLILDLAKDDMLKNYAPNCWAYLQSHPDALASVLNPDGTIYALPQVNSGAELRVSRKLFINKKWLENVNMQPPSTTEELYELLKAFKEQDANGNGDPNDEIPFCPFDWSSVQDVFFGAFGLANRGCHNQLVDCDEKTGDVRLIAASDGYKSYLEYLNRLYSEGLMDKYVFTTTMDTWTTNAESDRIGVFASTNLASLPAGETDNWMALDEALTGPAGDKLWTAIRANFQSTGAALIPSTCEDPALVLRWLDYFWTDEGTLFYHMGVENETFEVKADGGYDYMPFIYERMTAEGKSFDDVVAEYSPYPGGSNPTVEVAPYFMGGEMAEIPAKAARKLFAYGPEEYWPSFTFTAEESERLSVCRTDITKYTNSATTEFVTGAKPFTEWQDYIDRLDALGSKELLRVYQTAADRYRELINAEEK